MCERKRRITALALACLLLLQTGFSATAFTEEVGAENPVEGAWSGERAESFAGGSGTGEDPYVIETGEQLAHLADLAGEQEYARAHYLLAADIDLGGEPWTPIGTRYSPFAGSFDGGGRTITGLSVSGESGLGLFGYIDGGEDTAQVLNLTVEGEIILQAGTGELSGPAGGLAASATSARLTDCLVSVDIETAGALTGVTGVGGVIGETGGPGDVPERDVSLSGCVHRGEIAIAGETALTAVGGLAGDGLGGLDVADSYHTGEIAVVLTGESGTVEGVGGLLGRTNADRRTERCFSAGEVRVTASGGEVQAVGGFAGAVSGGETGEYSIVDCYTTADVVVSGGMEAVGGFVGIDGAQPLYMKSCYTAGSVRVTGAGADTAGAFIGGAHGTGDEMYLVDCYYDGDQAGGRQAVGGNRVMTAIDPAYPVGLDTLSMTRAASTLPAAAAGGLTGMTGFSGDTWTAAASQGASGYYPQLSVFANDARYSDDSKSSTVTTAHYYVIFHGNGGTADTWALGEVEDGIRGVVWAKYGETVSGPDYRLDGEALLRWNTLSWGGGRDYATGGFSVTEDLELYAIYPDELMPEPPVYTVTFWLNDGSDDDLYLAVEVTGGEQVERPEDPAGAAGYGVTGWYLDRAGETAYDFTGAVTGDLELYADWAVVLDVPLTDDHYAYLVGYPDGTIGPEESIKRSEVATILFRLISDDYRAEVWRQENGYSDVAVDDWFNNAVSTTSAAGLFGGYPDGTFLPDAPITRAELAVALVRLTSAESGYSGEDLFDDIDGHWAVNELNRAALLGWIEGDGDGTFRPDDPISRAETAAMINRVAARQPLDLDDLHQDMVTWPDNRDTTKWYYLDIQEATNSHHYHLRDDGVHETWTSLRESRDWTVLERADSRPGDIF